MADANQQTKWFTLSPEQVAKELGVDPAKGLSKSEVEARKQKYGANVLAGKKQEPGWQKFLRQWKWSNLLHNQPDINSLSGAGNQA